MPPIDTNTIATDASPASTDTVVGTKGGTATRKVTWAAGVTAALTTLLTAAGLALLVRGSTEGSFAYVDGTENVDLAAHSSYAMSNALGGNTTITGTNAATACASSGCSGTITVKQDPAVARTLAFTVTDATMVNLCGAISSTLNSINVLSYDCHTVASALTCSYCISPEGGDAEITALAGLTSAADRLAYFTGLGTASLATFTSFARTLLDDATAAAARTTLGLDPVSQAAIPIETDDTNDGYVVGSRVYSTAAQSWYVASDVTAGAAVWHRQASPAGRMIRMIEPLSGTTLTTMGIVATSNTGTLTHPALATTNLRTSLHRTTNTSAASANSTAATLYSSVTAGLLALRGDAAPKGGFYWDYTFSTASTTANQRGFWGLWAQAAVFGTTQDPDAMTDCFGVGWRSADTNVQAFTNDSSSTVTATDLGASFPANSTDAVYQVILYAAPSASTIYYVVRRLDTAAVAAGSFSSNLPTSTTYLGFHVGMNNGGTAAAVIPELMHAYGE